MIAPLAVTSRDLTSRDLTLSLSKGEAGCCTALSSVLMLSLSKHEDDSTTLSGHS